MLAIGYEADMGGTFARVEANWMEIGGETFTSTNNSDNKIVVEDIDGYGVRLSIGKTF